MSQTKLKKSLIFKDERSKMIHSSLVPWLKGAKRKKKPLMWGGKKSFQILWQEFKKLLILTYPNIKVKKILISSKTLNDYSYVIFYICMYFLVGKINILSVIKYSILMKLHAYFNKM